MATKVRAKKIFIGVKDDRFDDRRQSSILSILTDGNEIFLNQYGKMFTVDEIGNFDIIKTNNEAVLEFYPVDSRNEYTYSFISYDTKQNISTTDNFDFGNSVSIRSEHSTVGSSSSEVLYSIPDYYTSAKLMIELSSATSRDYEYNEINLISNNGEVNSAEYGRITLSDDPLNSVVGLGTYGIDYSGGNTQLIFYSDTSSELTSNVIGVSIANTDFSAVSSRGLRYADVRAVNVSIAASTAPIQQVITSYTSNYNLGYFIVQITDITNDELQLCEILVLNNEVETTIIEYGNVYTNSELGTFDSNASSTTELLFTPNENIDVEVKLLQHITSYTPFLSFPTSINFSNSELTTGISKLSDSSGANRKRDFDLFHNGNPIFEKRFDGSFASSASNLVGVNLEDDLINIPNHFFNSGEKVQYRSDPFSFLDIQSTTATITSGIGSDVVYVDSLVGILIGDYLNFQPQGYISVTGVGNSFVSLASTISSSITAGSGVTFSSLQETDFTSDGTSSIGIAQTYISGVGVTDKLSGDLYVYKLDYRSIGLCTSPVDALSSPPKLIDLTSVGIGNNHYITATNQNAKCIITIDNVVQAPIVSTGITATLEDNLELTDTTLAFSGITSFFGGDLIKIDDEIMLISSVGVGSTTFVEVQRPYMGTGISTHTTNSLITKLKGNYNITGNTVHFASAPYGKIENSEGQISDVTSTFQGRVFMRSADPTLDKETYQDNYIFDDISRSFNAINKDFSLTSDNNDISGISTSNSIILINNIFQSPENDYNLSEDAAQTELNFTGSATSISYDPNNASVPRGGIIVSVGSSSGYGFQPLVAAGGTAVVSVAGTIQSISIGNSGSGYRPGVQPVVNVGVQTYSSGTANIEFIGTATVSNGNIVSIAITNPGTGYTSTNPPTVVFDAPLSYSNLKLIYENPTSGLGTEAKIDIVVGQGFSIIDFKITNYGYSYDNDDILTIETGGISGIPTDSSLPFEPFLITVDRIYNDDFNGWSVGELQKLDDIDHLFNGIRTVFPILDNGNRFAILKKSGSGIDLYANLLIFINDVLQEPNVAYSFDGGSNIEFLEAPRSGDKCRILFYKGTPNIDTVEVDIVETIKSGDRLKLIGDQFKFVEKERLVSDIVLPDTAETLPYNSIGVTSDLNFMRPVSWCKQRNDLFINGVSVSKDRIRYEPIVLPTSNIIQPVSIGDTQIYVDGVKSYFDPDNENPINNAANKIEIVETTNIIAAIGTAVVSTAGTIQSITILDGGVGYTTSPSVSIQSPIGIGTTGRAQLTSTITGGSVSDISVVSPGFGYTNTNPPLIYIEPPTIKRETISNVSYIGDNGFISGISTANVGFASTALVLDLYIPENSYLRDSTITNPTITQSQIQEDYYLSISNSSVGSGVTSLRKDGSIIGIGTTGIDNIYQVISVATASTDVYGVGNTTVSQVTISVSGYNGLSGIGYSSYYGDYSWGIIQVASTSKEYGVDENYGVVGLNSTPTVRRYNQLKVKNYDV